MSHCIGHKGFLHDAMARLVFMFVEMKQTNDMTTHVVYDDVAQIHLMFTNHRNLGF